MTHTVTVTTRLRDAGTPEEERVVNSVHFVCTAAEDADCRRYPECDCESFAWDESGERDESGHPRVAGRECWLAAWFQADGAVYGGDDYDDYRDDCVPAVERSGEISVRWMDDYPEWVFVPDLLFWSLVGRGRRRCMAVFEFSHGRLT